MTFVSKCRRVVGFLMVVSLVLGQDYADYQDYGGDYQDDNLYHDYAQRQQEKGGGGG